MKTQTVHLLLLITLCLNCCKAQKQVQNNVLDNRLQENIDKCRLENCTGIVRFSENRHGIEEKEPVLIKETRRLVVKHNIRKNRISKELDEDQRSSNRISSIVKKFDNRNGSIRTTTAVLKKETGNSDNFHRLTTYKRHLNNRESNEERRISIQHIKDAFHNRETSRNFQSKSFMKLVPFKIREKLDLELHPKTISQTNMLNLKAISQYPSSDERRDFSNMQNVFLSGYTSVDQDLPKKTNVFRVKHFFPEQKRKEKTSQEDNTNRFQNQEDSRIRNTWPKTDGSKKWITYRDQGVLKERCHFQNDDVLEKQRLSEDTFRDVPEKGDMFRERQVLRKQDNSRKRDFLDIHQDSDISQKQDNSQRYDDFLENNSRYASQKQDFSRQKKFSQEQYRSKKLSTHNILRYSSQEPHIFHRQNAFVKPDFSQKRSLLSKSNIQTVLRNRKAVEIPTTSRINYDIRQNSISIRRDTRNAFRDQNILVELDMPREGDFSRKCDTSETRDIRVSIRKICKSMSRDTSSKQGIRDSPRERNVLQQRELSREDNTFQKQLTSFKRNIRNISQEFKIRWEQDSPRKRDKTQDNFFVQSISQSQDGLQEKNSLERDIKNAFRAREQILKHNYLYFSKERDILYTSNERDSRLNREFFEEHDGSGSRNPDVLTVSRKPTISISSNQRKFSLSRTVLRERDTSKNDFAFQEPKISLKRNFILNRDEGTSLERSSFQKRGISLEDTVSLKRMVWYATRELPVLKRKNNYWKQDSIRKNIASLKRENRPIFRDSNIAQQRDDFKVRKILQERAQNHNNYQDRDASLEKRYKQDTLRIRDSRSGFRERGNFELKDVSREQNLLYVRKRDGLREQNVIREYSTKTHINYNYRERSLSRKLGKSRKQVISRERSIANEILHLRTHERNDLNSQSRMFFYEQDLVLRNMKQDKKLKYQIKRENFSRSNLKFKTETENLLSQQAETPQKPSNRKPNYLTIRNKRGVETKQFYQLGPHYDIESALNVKLKSNRQYLSNESSSVILNVLYQIIVIGLMSFMTFQNKLKFHKSDER